MTFSSALIILSLQLFLLLKMKIPSKLYMFSVLNLTPVLTFFSVSGSGYSSNPRPDVVPGSVDDESDFADHVTQSGVASKSSSKPKHKQHQSVKKMSNAETRR